MADVLKVLMMGGQRTGKTSMLAGLIETMTHGTVKDIVEERCDREQACQSETYQKHRIFKMEFANLIW